MKISIKHNNTAIVIEDNSDLMQPSTSELEAILEKMSMVIKTMETNTEEPSEAPKKGTVSIDFNPSANGVLNGIATINTTTAIMHNFIPNGLNPNDKKCMQCGKAESLHNKLTFL
jgi:hypothetical protein